MGEERLIQRSKQVLSNSWSSELNQITGGYKEKYFKTQDFCSKYYDLTYQLLESQLQYLKWIREEIFEKNRLQINPKLPSRKKCVWFSCENNLEY